MRSTVQRAAAKLAGVVREMNEAQRLLLALRTAPQRVPGPVAAPDTYEEFLARTSGLLVHEPSARRRGRLARRG